MRVKIQADVRSFPTIPLHVAVDTATPYLLLPAPFLLGGQGHCSADLASIPSLYSSYHRSAAKYSPQYRLLRCPSRPIVKGLVANSLLV